MHGGHEEYRLAPLRRALAVLEHLSTVTVDVVLVDGHRMLQAVGLNAFGNPVYTSMCSVGAR